MEIETDFFQKTVVYIQYEVNRCLIEAKKVLR